MRLRGAGIRNFIHVDGLIGKFFIIKIILEV